MTEGTEGQYIPSTANVVAEKAQMQRGLLNQCIEPSPPPKVTKVTSITQVTNGWFVQEFEQYRYGEPMSTGNTAVFNRGADLMDYLAKELLTPSLDHPVSEVEPEEAGLFDVTITGVKHGETT